MNEPGIMVHVFTKIYSIRGFLSPWKSIRLETIVIYRVKYLCVEKLDKHLIFGGRNG